jgi:hypothetical protein
MFDPLREDSCWLALLEKYGMSPEQLAGLDFDLRLPEG